MTKRVCKKKYGTESILKYAGGSSRQACEERMQLIMTKKACLKVWYTYTKGCWQFKVGL